VGAYVAQVDRVLAAGQGLFPASTGPGSVGGGGEPAVPPAPSRSGLNVGVSGAGEDYRQSWRGVAALDVQTNGGAADGKAENERGQAGATGVRQTAQSQAAAIAPATGSPAGVKLLVSSMDERLAAMQREIDTTKAQNRLLATRLRQIAAAYRTAAATAPMGGASALGAMGGIRGLGGGMPNLGGLATAPMSAMSALARGGGAGHQPAALTGLFGPDARASGAAAQAVAYAKTKLGLPYVWGVVGPRAYDCSGLVMDAYAHAGISLPHHTYEQMQVGTRVSPNDIREGDRIYSNFSGPGRPEHVLLAISPTMAIEAPTPGQRVHITSIPSGDIEVRRGG